MSTTRPRTGTKQRLIEAALSVFAERGYDKATIQEIAELAAGANIAAVNYHFGDKARFHAEVIRAHLDRASGRAPAAEDPHDEPEKQLAAFIAWFVERVCGPADQAPLQHVLLREQLEGSSPVLDQVVERVMRPQHDRLKAIVAALLPPETPEDVLRRQTFSVISQCTCYHHAWPVMQRLYPDLELDEDERGAIAEHVTRSCLAALAAEAERQRRHGGGTRTRTSKTRPRDRTRKATSRRRDPKESTT